MSPSVMIRHNTFVPSELVKNFIEGQEYEGLCPSCYPDEVFHEDSACLHAADGTEYHVCDTCAADLEAEGWKKEYLPLAWQRGNLFQAQSLEKLKKYTDNFILQGTFPPHIDTVDKAREWNIYNYFKCGFCTSVIGKDGDPLINTREFDSTEDPSKIMSFRVNISAHTVMFPVGNSDYGGVVSCCNACARVMRFSQGGHGFKGRCCNCREMYPVTKDEVESRAKFEINGGIDNYLCPKCFEFVRRQVIEPGGSLRRFVQEPCKGCQNPLFLDLMEKSAFELDTKDLGNLGLLCTSCSEESFWISSSECVKLKVNSKGGYNFELYIHGGSGDNIRKVFVMNSAGNTKERAMWFGYQSYYEELNKQE